MLQAISCSNGAAAAAAAGRLLTAWCLFVSSLHSAAHLVALTIHPAPADTRCNTTSALAAAAAAAAAAATANAWIGGPIPSVLQRLSGLTDINLSNNFLTGAQLQQQQQQHSNVAITSLCANTAAAAAAAATATEESNVAARHAV
jgi:hypothetical protein